MLRNYLIFTLKKKASFHYLLSINLLILLVSSCVHPVEEVGNKELDNETKAIALEEGNTIYQGLSWNNLETKTIQKPLNLSGIYKGIFGEEERAFYLDLLQTNDSLTGYYSFNSNKELNVEEYEVNGSIDKGIATIYFQTELKTKPGVAKLSMNNYNIEWITIDNEFSKIEVPEMMTLENQKKPYDSTIELVNIPSGSINFFMVDTPEKGYIFRETPVYNDLKQKTAQNKLVAGTFVTIVKDTGEYMMYQLGDEIIENFYYEVEYKIGEETQVGYIEGHEVARTTFKDNLGNLIMLGASEDFKSLEFVVVELNGKVARQDIDLNNADYARHLDNVFNLNAQINFHPNTLFTGYSFFEININFGGGYATSPFSRPILYSWNGKILQRLTPDLEKDMPKRYVHGRGGKGHVYHITQQVSFEIINKKYPSLKIEMSYHNSSSEENEKLYYYYRIRHGALENYRLHEPIKMAYLGNHDELSFPNEYEYLNWYGVVTTNETVQIVPVKLKVGKKIIENELTETSYTIKQLKLLKVDNEIDFLIADFPREWLNRKNNAGKFEKDFFGIGQSNRILFSYCDWRFFRTGRPNENGEMIEEGLYIGGTKNDNYLEYELNYEPFREVPVTYNWVGDLDGDNLPDFVLDIAKKGIATEKTLYLSSWANPDKLVGVGGWFLSQMAGC